MPRAAFILLFGYSLFAVGTWYVAYVWFPGVTSQTQADNPCLMLVTQTVTDSQKSKA